MQNDLIGRKIIVTNTSYPNSIPNGTVMTISRDYGGGYVSATVDFGSRFNWFMHDGDWKLYHPHSEPKGDLASMESTAQMAAKHGIAITVVDGKIATLFDGRPT